MSIRPWPPRFHARVAALALFAICISSHAQAQQAAPQKIRVLCLARPLPVMIAESRGILAKYGIEVEYLVRPSSESLRNDLANGKGDVAFLAVDNDVAIVDSAGVDVVIVMGAESSENEIIAQPGTKSIADLRGRTLLVDATNTAYALELKKVLQMDGMQPGKDYQLKPVGSTPFRLQAMRDSREYAAAVMNPPFSIVAKQAGMVSLGTMRALLGGLGSWNVRAADVGSRKFRFAGAISRSLRGGAALADGAFQPTAGGRTRHEGIELNRAHRQRLVRGHGTERRLREGRCV
jgi:ABC-type nitrate/sulfonate/bicarbonate transport system substrate-binding protein